MQDHDGLKKDTPTKPPPKYSIFDVPAPLRQLFARYPLLTYDANELPLDSPRRRDEHTLHIFTTEEDAKNGRPSYNPSCLKWQTFLQFSGLSFRLVKSNNHASPSGALPFLQPAVKGTDLLDPVPSNRLKKWLAAQRPGQKAADADEDIRYEAYASLLDNRVRKAWLYQLYLCRANTALMHRLYVAPCSSNFLVQYAISSQLRSAAETELVKSSGTTVVSAKDLIRDAEDAFEALSTLLGGDEWFFGKQKPELFDASVFAYTQLVLDEKLGWEENPLGDVLKEKHGNLVRHRERIAGEYY
ncbi:related to mitochondrial outer membrane protein (Sam35) [Ramularia collo-cygni]|uniref:Related to mitochondrial outer membrane protein (Sam35) n=1 Tax=Ramularia collo-cygni TaxID=112498 RepID=A0A2D3V9T2_9PEZI|nr:related to mitochondrial outer membrane protein (Sam35) [Ramularia collo-cygni]CZT24793.1 related to mitochondrial outer membrane protein (Sam35) [Ramularia collo-cygni]